ncbi:MAG TPA: hypothetical protein VK021_03170 [Flavobacteriaceae bacterium]|nr:hypothetical protein [Flavobacteriaceae bacterium]
MRVFSLLIFVIILTGFSQNNTKKNYLTLNSSEFIVKGKTSIGKFDCKHESQAKDTLLLYKENGFSKKIRVRKFSCGNFILTGDFRKTLKHKEYPEVYFRLMDVQPNDEKFDKFTFDLYLKIAGKEKFLEDLTLTQKNEELHGEVQLKFSDFDLKPPRKLGGAITVEEDIKLVITLSIEDIELWCEVC